MKLLNNKKLISGIASVILLAVYMLFGFKAVLFLIVFALMVLPFYLLLGLFELEKEERLIFSVFIAIGMFSSLVYWSGFLFSSLKIAVIAVFLLLIGYWAILRKINIKNKFREEIILMGLFGLLFIIGLLIKSIAIGQLPVPEHVVEYLNCLENNISEECSDLVKYIKF